LACCLLVPVAVFAQDTDLLLNTSMYPYVDRVDVLGYAGKTIHTDTKPYGRKAVTLALRQADTAAMSVMERRWHARMRLLADDSLAALQQPYQRLGKVKYVYANRRDLLAFRSAAFELYVNPAAHLALGAEAGDSSSRLMVNSRGVTVRGSLYGKVGFYTEVYDNQLYLPTFATLRMDSDPNNQYQNMFGEVFVKKFKDKVGSADFFTSRAYLTFSPLPCTRIKFGKDRAFWGNGSQSLMLNDFAADYLFLTATTKIWKLEYVNHFTQMFDYVRDRQDTEGPHPRKYGVWHALYFKPNRNISVGVWESVIYTPWQPNGYRGFELQYLNPIIFYRAAEQAIGSPDNGLLGATFKVNFLKRAQVYGQFLMDDFNFGATRNSPSGKAFDFSYWGNKLGYQLGAKYMNAFGISTFDLQAEYNLVRPWVYQHFNQAGNFTQYGQVLGHSWGSNVREWTVQASYQPLAALHLHAQYGRAVKGEGFNGSDLTQPYIAPTTQYGYKAGDGPILHTASMLYLRASWQIAQTDIYVEAEARVRQEMVGTVDYGSTSAIAGVRFGIPSRPMRF
jgi:hypothetical protein